ncbi:hypothetical protein SLS55_006029 [Diplodia seriata]|uniref:F-box domain-containing protein n=1 Tax=Diplodia seriata TaxID=420778 RepID=A0ABR3CD43_9PEZI
MNQNNSSNADWLALVSQPPANGRSPLSNVPKDVFLVLMESLDCAGLCGMRGTCRQLRNLIDKEVVPAEDSSNVAAAIRLSLTPSTVLDDSRRQDIDIIFTINNISTFTHHVSSANGVLPKFIKNEGSV